MAHSPAHGEVAQFATDGQTHPRVEVTLAGDFDNLSPAIGAAICRMVQEFITNARRHAATPWPSPQTLTTYDSPSTTTAPPAAQPAATKPATAETGGSKPTCLEAFANTPTSRPQEPMEPLTPREAEVLVLGAQGRTNAVIACELYITMSTVKAHAASLMRKLGARNRVEVATWAYETGRV